MKFWVALSILLFALTGLADSPRITDELVSNLSCRHLSPASIYAAIKPSAMNIPRRMTIENWDANMIQQCWSLSRFQRIALLLGRHGDPVARKVTPKRVAEFARGWGYGPRPNTRGIEEKPIDFDVFNWPFANDGKDYDMPIILQSISAALAPYSLETAISDKQYRLFYRGSNLGYVFLTPSFAEQTASLKEIFRRTQLKRLPMFNVRKARTDQHVLLGLSVKELDKNKWEMQVIDPNHPTSETTLHISRANGAFRMKLEQPWAANPIDEVDAAYLFDDGEEQKIDLALVRHYGEKCSLAAASN